MLTDEAIELLSSELYIRAFAKAMSGEEILLTTDERDALKQVRELTNTPGPGHSMLMPIRNELGTA